MTPVMVKAVGSLIWIVCGIIVIIIRTLIIQTTSVYLWEILGGVMIAWGAARLIWALAKRPPADASLQ